MNVADISQAGKRYRNDRLTNWRPPERLNVWQWAERAIVLSERTSPFPGRYRHEITPYCCGPMEAITDRRTKTVILVFCTQSGKTQNLIIIPAAYTLAQDPGPALIILPNEPMARSFSETRLRPVFDDSPEIEKLKPTDTDRYKLLEMHFTRSTLNLIGSNSPANLAQRPIRYLFGDEIDKYPPANEREADGLSLGLERTKAFWNCSRVLSSSPTTPDGNIWRWWNRSDQGHFLIACPHCGKKQKLIFGLTTEYDLFSSIVPRPPGPPENLYRLKWPKDCAISELDGRAWYECIKCKGKIYDRDKLAAIQKGTWTPAARSDGVAGFHLNALSVPWIRFGEIAAEFLRAKRYPDQLQNFYNSWLALPWDAIAQGTDTIKLSDIMQTANTENASSYLVNTCPPGVVFLTVGIDVQAHEIYYVVRGWGLGGASWLVSFGRVQVETDDVEDFVAVVADIMSRNYGRPLILGGIDSGWGKRTAEVYTIARVVPRLVCTKGRRSNITRSTDGKDIPVPPPKRIDRMPDGKKLEQGPLLYSPSTSYWKRWLIGRIKAKPKKWQWPEGLEESKDGRMYLEHMESEKEVTRRNKRSGKSETVWIVKRKRKKADDLDVDEMVDDDDTEGRVANHLLDCEIIAAVVQEIALTAGGPAKLSVDDVVPLADELAQQLQQTPDTPRRPVARKRRRKPKSHDL